MRLLNGYKEDIPLRRKTTPKFWVFMIIAMLIIFGCCFGVAWRQYALGRDRLEQVEAYRNELAQQVDELSDELDYAQTDDYIERAARDELGMIKPGEVRYVNSGS